jgi:hypothetical protein
MNAATKTLPMHSLGCVGCTAKTPSVFDSAGDPSVRARQILCGDGLVRREVLCDWCASKQNEVR